MVFGGLSLPSRSVTTKVYMIAAWDFNLPFTIRTSWWELVGSFSTIRSGNIEHERLFELEFVSICGWVPQWRSLFLKNKGGNF
jgi:hypothetical protein